MSSRIKTLVLDADGGGWSYVTVDTILRGLLRSRMDIQSLPKVLRSSRWSRRLLGPRYGHLSYVLDWREAFLEASELDTELCNINNVLEFRRHRAAIRAYPLIVVLHSATGDSMGLLRRTAHWFSGRRGRLIVFIGNEYSLMEDKLDFLRDTGADYVCSQLPDSSARFVYAETPARVMALPHALNPRVYKPGPPERPIDIGFCGDLYYPFIGDSERTALIQHFQQNGVAFGLRTEFRFNNRMPRDEWAACLRRSYATLGAESGTYYLDRHGHLLEQAKTYYRRHLDASSEDIAARFFRSATIPIASGKAISSRHFEPIGTKTCQILLEGNYNGILKPGVHYIPISKDLSDVAEAVQMFKDEALRSRIVNTAYEYVMDQHTYAHRIRELIATVFGMRETLGGSPTQPVRMVFDYEKVTCQSGHLPPA